MSRITNASRLANPSVGASTKECVAFASFWGLLNEQLRAIDGSKPASFNEALHMWNLVLPCVDCALILIQSR